MTETLRELIARTLARELHSAFNNHPRTVNDVVTAVLSALKEQGFAVVPIEPSDAMKRAPAGIGTGDAQFIWAAMIQAAGDE